MSSRPKRIVDRHGRPVAQRRTKSGIIDLATRRTRKFLLLGAAGLAFVAGIVANLEGIRSFLERLRTSGEPAYENLIDSVADFVVKADILRVSKSGEVAITPVCLFRNPERRKYQPENLTYLLCRFTNTSERVITIGAVVDDGSSYRLEDPGLGYKPTTISLEFYQLFLRGASPRLKEELRWSRERARREGSSVMQLATIEPGRTKYAYIQGTAWPETQTFSIIDVTDTIVGSVELRIALAD